MRNPNIKFRKVGHWVNFQDIKLRKVLIQNYIFYNEVAEIKDHYNLQPHVFIFKIKLCSILLVLHDLEIDCT